MPCIRNIPLWLHRFSLHLVIITVTTLEIKIIKNISESLGLKLLEDFDVGTGGCPP
jgi:hypothetical protein